MNRRVGWKEASIGTAKRIRSIKVREFAPQMSLSLLEGDWQTDFLRSADGFSRTGVVAVREKPDNLTRDQYNRGYGLVTCRRSKNY